MIEIDGAPLALSAVALVGIAVKQAWPIIGPLLSARGKITIDDRRTHDERRQDQPQPHVYTKEEHDKWCGLRLDNISTRLTGIESKMTDVKEHEADAKETVREVKESVTKIWDRIDDIIRDANLNHIETIKAINAIGK